MKIIDAHVHVVQCIAGTTSGGEMRPAGKGWGETADGGRCQLIPAFLGETQVTPESVLKLMNENQVERAVLLQGNFMGFQNLYSWDAQQRWPERFLAAAAYDPFSGKREAILHRLFEELGFRVVKHELSTGSGLMANHGILDIDGEILEREFSYADDHGLICVVDIGKLGSKSAQVAALRRVIARHGGMKFVVCHVLAPKSEQWQLWRESMEALCLPNVWFDLAALSSNLRPDAPPYPVTRKFLKEAANIAGSHRLMFGSDLPSTLCSHQYADLIRCIGGHPDLSSGQKQEILYDNALRVFWE